MALQALNYEIDDLERFVRQAQHIEFGLSSEDEFAAIAAWCGRCRLIHKLDQAVMHSPSLPFEGTVPDLYMIVEHKGISLPVLVEVKTTKDLVLRLTDAYLAKLQMYARQLKLPLLVAWRSRKLGWWCLFDPADVRSSDGAGIVRFEEMMPYCLMSHFIGDFIVVPKEGARMTFHLEPLGPREPTEDGFTQQCRIASVDWYAANGEPCKPTNGAALAVMARSKLVDVVDDGEVTKSWIATGGHIQAQQLLRASVGFNLKENERIHWRHIEDLEQILSSRQLEEDAAACFGSFAKYVLHMQPRVWPSWYPETWKLTKPGEGGDDG